MSFSLLKTEFGQKFKEFAGPKRTSDMSGIV